MQVTKPVLNIETGRMYWIVGICNESGTDVAQSYPYPVVMYRDVKTNENFTLAKTKFTKLFREATPTEMLTALK